MLRPARLAHALHCTHLFARSRACGKVNDDMAIFTMFSFILDQSALVDQRTKIAGVHQMRLLHRDSLYLLLGSV